MTLLTYNNNQRGPTKQVEFHVDGNVPWSFSAAMRRILGRRLHPKHEKSLLGGSSVPTDQPHTTGRFANVEMPAEVVVVTECTKLET